MSERGEFPPLLWLSERRARVRADQLAEWLRQRELAGPPGADRRDFAKVVGRGSAMPRADLPSGRRRKNAARRPKPTGRASREFDENPRLGILHDGSSGGKAGGAA
jgi:hypothetical protein